VSDIGTPLRVHFVQETAMQCKNKLENGIKSKDQRLENGYELSRIITPPYAKKGVDILSKKLPRSFRGFAGQLYTRYVKRFLVC
jgi:hypothetical protein